MQGKARAKSLSKDPVMQAHTGERGESIKRVPEIVISGLTKRYGQKVAISDVDLRITPGTFLVLLGPSGSGKTTLLRCLAGIERPTSGTIRFDDLIVEGPAQHIPPERRNLAMVFQDYALWPHLTAEQNVDFALQRSGKPAVERKNQVEAILAQVGLGSLGDRYPSQLSGGEQQRVGLARALVANPGVLLFDEPLSNLDADRRERLRVDIGAMVRRYGASAVYITHDQAEAFALADEIGVLNNGSLVQIGTPEEIYRSPVNAFVARFTGLAGELSGQVISRNPDGDSNYVAVDMNGSTIIGKAIGASNLIVGEPVELLIRPSAVRFVDRYAYPSRSGYLGNTLSQRPPCRVDATVLDAAFRGWGYEHEVSIGGGFRLSGIPFHSRIPFMSRAVVELFPEGCLVAAVEGRAIKSTVEKESSGIDEAQAEFLQYLTYGSDI